MIKKYFFYNHHRFFINIAICTDIAIDSGSGPARTSSVHKSMVRYLGFICAAPYRWKL